ncbi:MAG: hypothetical protein WAK96_04475 [Desulfobaccales bacterium]
MAFLKPSTLKHCNFLVILLITVLFSGCAAVGAQQLCQNQRILIRCPDRTENVQVIHVGSDQIYGQDAVRVHYPDGRWVVYLAEDVGPEVLNWELSQIALGTIWDKI